MSATRHLRLALVAALALIGTAQVCLAPSHTPLVHRVDPPEREREILVS